MVPSHVDPEWFPAPLGTWLRRASLALIVAVLLAGCGVSGQAAAPTPTPLPPQPAVESPTYTVQRGNIVEELQLSGRVASTREDDLSFAKAGNVAKIYVRETEPITKGQLLAELDTGDLPNQLQQAQIAFDQAKLALQRGQDKQKYAVQLAQLDLQEAQIRRQQATSPADQQLADIGVRRAQINLAQAQAAGADLDLQKQVDAAKLAYDRLKSQVDAGRLYAPYNGQVSSIAAQPGTALDAYKPVMTVIDPHQREIRVDNALSTDLSRLSPQQPVTIQFSRYPDTPVKGAISRLPGTTPSKQSTSGGDTAVHIKYDPGNLSLDFGDLARVTVTLQRKDNVLWLPPQAIRTFQGRRFVVVDEGNRQRRVDVKLGIQGPDRVEIVEGLKEGQKVVGQ